MKVCLNPCDYKGRDFWKPLVTIKPLILVTTRSGKGVNNGAVKSLALQCSFEPYRYGFVCTPDHDTYKNIKETREFGINFPAPEFEKNIMSFGRDFPEDIDEMMEAGIQVFYSEKGSVPLISDCYFSLECRLDQIIDWENSSLIIGRVYMGWANSDYIQKTDKEKLEDGILSYLYPVGLRSFRD